MCQQPISLCSSSSKRLKHPLILQTPYFSPLLAPTQIEFSILHSTLCQKESLHYKKRFSKPSSFHKNKFCKLNQNLDSIPICCNILINHDVTTPLHNSTSASVSLLHQQNCVLLAHHLSSTRKCHNHHLTFKQYYTTSGSQFH
jgi:hypothetical protein